MYFAQIVVNVLLWLLMMGTIGVFSVILIRLLELIIFYSVQFDWIGKIIILFFTAICIALISILVEISYYKIVGGASWSLTVDNLTKGAGL